MSIMLGICCHLCWEALCSLLSKKAMNRNNKKDYQIEDKVLKALLMKVIKQMTSQWIRACSMRTKACSLIRDNACQVLFRILIPFTTTNLKILHTKHSQILFKNLEQNWQNKWCTLQARKKLRKRKRRWRVAMNSKTIIRKALQALEWAKFQFYPTQTLKLRNNSWQKRKRDWTY